MNKSQDISKIENDTERRSSDERIIDHSQTIDLNLKLEQDDDIHSNKNS